MSNRPLLPPNPVIVNGDMSGNITSAPTVLLGKTVGCYTYSWAGAAPVGSVSIEISNDYSLFANGTVNNPGTWTAVFFQLNGSLIVNSAPISGNSGNGAIDWSTGANAIRTVYTATSGTGSLQAIIASRVT